MKIKLEYTVEEAALLYEAFESTMEECMSLNSKHRVSKELLFTDEQLEHLQKLAKFCCVEMMELRRKLRIEP